MELDLTTVVLEALNFLILVWLLKRFFYRPVLAVIEQRQAESARVIADAGRVRAAAEALKNEYDGRLATVAVEREQARKKLAEDLAGEREQRLAAVVAEAEAERERRRLLLERGEASRQAALERTAVGFAAAFASRFLGRLAGPELEAKLAQLALADLAHLPEAACVRLRAAAASPAALCRVVSVWPLAVAEREAFAAALSGLVGRPLMPEFTENARLQCGLRIEIGDWALMANVHDELAFFALVAAHEAEP